MAKPTARDTFRFTRSALVIRTEKSSQKLVLLALAIRTNGRTGTCHPSYECLCRDTGLSRSVVAASLKYLRDTLKVLTWKQGHSNQYMTPIANLYTLDFPAMEGLAAESAESDWDNAESDSDSAESISRSAESQNCTPTTQATTTQNKQLPNIATAPPPAGLRSKAGTQVQPAKVNIGALSPANELSNVSPASELSEVPHTVPTPSLADLHRRLTPDNQKRWYKRTNGEGGAEGRRVALEILATQGAE